MNIENDETKISDKKILLKMLDENPWNIRKAIPALTRDKDVGLKAVSKKGETYLCLGSELKKDKDIIMIALNTWNGYQDLDLNLYDDKDILLRAIEFCAVYFNFTSPQLKEDRDVVLKVVEKDGLFLFKVNNSFKDDDEVVEKALSENVWALYATSERIQNKKENLYMFEEKVDREDFEIVDYVPRYLLEKWVEDKMMLIEKYRKEDEYRQSMNVQVKAVKIKKF